MQKSLIKDKNRSKAKMNVTYKKAIINFTVPLIIHSSITFITCFIIFTADMNIQDNYFFIALSLAVSYFLSAYFIGKRLRKNGIAIGNIYNILPTLIYVFTSLSLNGFSFNYRLYVVLALHLAASSIGGIIAVNSRTKTNKRKK